MGCSSNDPIGFLNNEVKLLSQRGNGWFPCIPNENTRPLLCTGKSDNSTKSDFVGEGLEDEEQQEADIIVNAIRMPQAAHVCIPFSTGQSSTIMSVQGDTLSEGCLVDDCLENGGKFSPADKAKHMLVALSRVPKCNEGNLLFVNVDFNQISHLKRIRLTTAFESCNQKSSRPLYQQQKLHDGHIVCEQGHQTPHQTVRARLQVNTF